MKKLLSLSLVLMCLLVSTKLSAIEVIDSRPDYSGGTYEEYTMDMKVKVLGGYVSIKRHYGQDGWLLHPNWQSLKFYDAAENKIVLAEYYQDPANTHADLIIGEIKRERYVYKPLSSQNKSTFRDQYDPSKSIVKTETGYRWESRTGDWIEYDQYGVAQKYGNKNDVTVTLVRDEKNRVKAIQDHFGSQVITIDYSVANQITVTDYDNRTLIYHGSFPFISKVTDVRGNDWQYEYTEIKGKKYLSKKIDPENRETTIGHELVPGSVQTIITGDDNPTWTLEEYTDPDTGETVVRERMVESDSSASRSQFVPAMVMFTHLIYDDGARVDFKYYYNQQTKTYSSVSKTSDGIHRDQWFGPDGKLKRSSVGGKLLFTRAESQDGSKSIRVDAEGRKVTTHYDQWEKPTKIVAADGSTTTYSYHPQFSYPVEIIDARGVKTTNEFDAKGNLIRVTRAKGSGNERITEFEYDAYGQVKLVRQVGNAVTDTAETIFDYDDYGNIIKVTDQEGFEKLYHEYNALGQAAKFTDGRKKVWSFVYDNAGNLKERSSPLGFKNTFVYDKVNNLKETTDAESNPSSFIYDVRNRLTTATNALEETYEIRYALDGMPKEAINREGHKTLLQYDLQRRLKSVNNEEGLFTEYHYKNEDSHALSDLDSIITTNGKVKFQLDQRGRIVQQTQASLDESLLLATKFEFDAISNVTKVTDARTHSSKYVYNEHNELVKIINALDHIIELEYDARGNLITVIDPKLSTTRYEYDKRGLRTAEYRPMGEKTTYQYDEDGNLTRVIDAKGQVIEYVYDDNLRMEKENLYLTETSEQPEKTITYNYNKNGVMTGYDDGVTSAVFSVDELSRVKSVTTNYGPFSKTHSYSYHKDGEVASFTNAENITSSYSYDKANRLKLIGISGHGSVSFNQYQGYSPTEIVYPGGIKVTHDYDGIGRLKTKAVDDPAGNDLQNENYHYDEVSNITSKSTDDGEYQYTYDEINRLINANQPQPLQNRSYQYDEVGNRIGTEIEGQNWDYNANHELLGYGLTDTKTVFEYDANGSTIKKTDANGIEEYIYNIAGRLVEVQRNGESVAKYYYDPFGRRLYKEVSGNRTYFLYSNEGLSGEYDNSGTAIRSYQYFPNHYWGTKPLALIENGEAYFYQHDQLGTPNLLTSKTGETQWKGMVDAYGEVHTSVSSINNPLRFPGQVQNIETGYYYNFLRDYNPQIGRYMQSDPIGLLGGVNYYNYVHSMPTRLIDPLGLSATIPQCNGLEPSDECNFLRSRIIEKHLKFTKELSKYDPVSDAIGGHKMKYGSGKTKPYGHYKELTDLQRGIKNDIKRYNDLCRGGGGGPPLAEPIPKYIDADANKLIPLIDQSEFRETSDEYCARNPYKCAFVATGVVVLAGLRIPVGITGTTGVAAAAAAL
ncbi:RHS repeat-associated core domain-containing protein [Kangiella sp. M94]